MEREVPRHVAIIMDGNGRWAKKRLLPRGAGHRAGFERMLALAAHAFDTGVRYLTLYALSAENLSRPKEELEGLFSLFRRYFEKETKTLRSQGIGLRILGDPALLPSDLAANVRAYAGGGEGERGILSLAIGYGARQEILAAVNRAVREGGEVDAARFSSLLTTSGIPDPDLVIRTGGERRLSNFLLWQSAYAELYFTDKFFPDFSEEDLDAALAEYAKRDRRYGNV